MNTLYECLGKHVTAYCKNGKKISGLCEGWQEEYPEECEENILISSENGTLIELLKSEIEKIEIIEPMI